MTTKRIIPKILLSAIILTLGIAITTSCSSTSNMPEGDILYSGIKSIEYKNLEDNSRLTKAQNDTLSTHIATTKAEIEASLASAPNGSFMGSSIIKSPFPMRLWIYNAFANSEKGIGRWLRNTFGKRWITIDDVNPELHATVATNVLKSYGYFNGNVDYSIIPSANPRKAYVSYNVDFSNLSVLDTITRMGFPQIVDSIIEANSAERCISIGSPFSAAALEAERTRLSNLLRNEGFYLYKKEYITYEADSVSIPGHVLLHIKPSEDMPEEVNKRWFIGHLRVEMRRTMREQLTDSTTNRFFTLLYNENRPIRPSVILRDITFRRGEPFSYDRYQQTVQNLASAALFSSFDFNFVPREGTDTLDVTLNCVFDKPYDVTFEAGLKGNSNSRLGPNLTLGLTKRNALHGGESLNLSLFGDYQWQLKSGDNDNGGTKNYYVYGFKASLEYPRLETPFHIFTKKRHRYYATPKTNVFASYSCQNRPDYFKYITLSAGLTYTLQTSESSRHEFSPLLFDYSFVGHETDKFYELMNQNVGLLKLQDLFVPKIQYTYTYSSPTTYINPITWRTTISEASNLVALGYVIAGKKWNEKDKILFKNPFSQYVRLETDFVKRWRTGDKSNLVFHLNGGIIYSYGNSETNITPYNEQFFVGGANSLRAFASHGIGPGNTAYDDESVRFNMLRTGSLKFETNLEYRFGIIGDLYGALFIDAGNVWNMMPDLSNVEEEYHEEIRDMYRIDFFRQLATDAGVGLRYDLGFLMLRLDWAAALHMPYNTSKTGYFNVDDFKRSNTLHFAIGLPF